MRRCALKNTRGGGLNVDPSAPFFTAGGVPIPLNLSTSECYDPARPGFLMSQANPDLAQVAMAGGNRLAGFHPSTRRQQSRQRVAGGTRRRQNKRTRRGRKQRGGNKGGFEVDVSTSVGGTGPVAAPVYARVPCDMQAGSGNPSHVSLLPDLRAPSDLYSVSPNQSGGAEAFDASCYRATGSSMPVYPASSVGFRFEPATEGGVAPPDGGAMYMNVVPVVARTGGARTYKKRNPSRRHRTRRHRTRRHKA